MIYLCSSGILVILFLLFPKTTQKQNFVRSLAIYIFAYEGYLCLIAGLMTVLHISVNIYSISFVNVLFCILIIVMLYKKKQLQSYYVKMYDASFIILYALFISYIVIKRFTPNLEIVFETSDPGTHLKMAMNLINSKAVDGMYLGQLIDGLFIESILSKFSGAFVYKSFIIQYGINFFLSGYIFWAALQNFGKNFILKLFVYAVTIVYVMGYPYNDMLFGFVYLQMTVSVVCYLFAVTQDYLNAEGNGRITSGLMSVGCLGVSMGYTLFAPTVYLSVLCCIGYKAYKEGWLLSSTRKILNRKFIRVCLQIFLVPTMMTLYFLIIVPKLTGTSSDYGKALNFEGYIYRNLYSDFILYLIFALYGVFYTLKNKKLNLFTFLYPITLLYAIYFFVQMLCNKVSTYYFYKFNFLFWPIILILFFVGISELMNNQKMLCCCYFLVLLLLSFLNFSQLEVHWNQKNVNYVPFADAQGYFRIYNHNKIYEERKSQVSNEFIEICDVVNEKYKEDTTVFIGYWLEFYWYEALTNQRFPQGYVNLAYADLLKECIDGKCGKYAVIAKNAEGMELYQDYITSHSVFEGDYAYIIQNY